jgi:hypothetical protein
MLAYFIAIGLKLVIVGVMVFRLRESHAYFPFEMNCVIPTTDAAYGRY